MPPDVPAKTQIVGITKDECCYISFPELENCKHCRIN